MMGMASLPVRKDHHTRTRPANHSCNLQPVDPGVLNPAVRYVQSFAPGDAKKTRSFVGFAFAIGGRAACAHLTASEIEDSRMASSLRSVERSAATGLLNVITMRAIARMSRVDRCPEAAVI